MSGRRSFVPFPQELPGSSGGGGGGGGGFTAIRITHAQSPFAALPGDYVVVDASGGPVVVNLPVLEGPSNASPGVRATTQAVTVAQDSDTALSSTITVNGPAGVQIDQIAPVNGTYVNSFVFGPATNWTSPDALGLTITWANLGSKGGYSIAE